MRRLIRTTGYCYISASAHYARQDMKRKTTEFGRWLCVPFNRRQAFRRLAEFLAAKRPLDEIVRWAMNFGTKAKFRGKTAQILSRIPRGMTVGMLQSTS